MTQKFILSLVFTFSPLMANAATSAEIHFSDTMLQYEKCAQQGCAEFTEKELLSFDTNILNADLHKALLAVADDQALIWSDTILEGDYHAEGDTRLDEVIAVYQQNKLVAYKITYSQKAYDTGSCDFDWDNKASLAECTPGRISETTVVASDFSNYSIFADYYANFED